MCCWKGLGGGSGDRGLPISLYDSSYRSHRPLEHSVKWRILFMWTPRCLSALRLHESGDKHAVNKYLRKTYCNGKKTEGWDETLNYWKRWLWSNDIFPSYLVLGNLWPGTPLSFSLQPQPFILISIPSALLSDFSTDSNEGRAEGSLRYCFSYGRCKGPGKFQRLKKGDSYWKF